MISRRGEWLGVSLAGLRLCWIFDVTIPDLSMGFGPTDYKEKRGALRHNLRYTRES